jgi:multimeric flavodoxin WrbA
MKVIAINGSVRKNGNTQILIDTVLAEIEKCGIQTESIQLADYSLVACRACRKCAENLDGLCALEEAPIVNECITKMRKADGIILGSPTYFANASPDLLSLISRAGVVARTNDDMFKRKVGAAVVALRRGGANHAFNSINHFFFISQMIVPGSNYWNMGFGKTKGEVNEDKEGIEIMQILGKNMAWLMKKINS